jgi:hypothetical protein
MRIVTIPLPNVTNEYGKKGCVFCQVRHGKGLPDLEQVNTHAESIRKVSVSVLCREIGRPLRRTKTDLVNRTNHLTRSNPSLRLNAEPVVRPAVQNLSRQNRKRFKRPVFFFSFEQSVAFRFMRRV